MSHYDVLGVSRLATLSEIKKAYHQQALKFHPDKLHSSALASEEEFKKLQTAYEILSDIEGRRRYDAELCPPRSWFSFLGTLFTSCLGERDSEETQCESASSPRC